MKQQQVVLSWLKDAHAMEVGALPTLQSHASAAQKYPELQAKLSAHAEASTHHAELLEGCIEHLGGRPSVFKEAVGSVLGKVGGVANLPAKDTIIKNALGDYAAEGFEIASYTSLVAAAEKLGDQEVITACRQILRDEEEMAEWLEGYIPTLTQTFLDDQTGEDDDAWYGALEEVKDNVDQKGILLALGLLVAGVGVAILLSRDDQDHQDYRKGASYPNQYPSYSAYPPYQGR